MNTNKTKFDDYIGEEVRKYKGVYRPLRAGVLRRVFVRKLACKRIHPNPDDEFCDPKIGPNYDIVSRYSEEIRAARLKENNPLLFKERIIVERIHPDGYMLLNGHHRWAAAIRMGLPKIRTKVVNLTQVSDIREMLRNAKHEKRVTLDLDEVVFVSDPGAESEKPLPFPLSLRYKERLRRGNRAVGAARGPARVFMMAGVGWIEWRTRCLTGFAAPGDSARSRRRRCWRCWRSSG